MSCVQIMSIIIETYCILTKILYQRGSALREYLLLLVLAKRGYSIVPFATIFV